MAKRSKRGMRKKASGSAAPNVEEGQSTDEFITEEIVSKLKMTVAQFKESDYFASGKFAAYSPDNARVAKDLATMNESESSGPPEVEGEKGTYSSPADQEEDSPAPPAVETELPMDEMGPPELEVGETAQVAVLASTNRFDVPSRTGKLRVLSPIMSEMLGSPYCIGISGQSDSSVLDPISRAVDLILHPATTEFHKMEIAGAHERVQLSDFVPTGMHGKSVSYLSIPASAKLYPKDFPTGRFVHVPGAPVPAPDDPYDGSNVIVLDGFSVNGNIPATEVDRDALCDGVVPTMDKSGYMLQRATFERALMYRHMIQIDELQALHDGVREIIGLGEYVDDSESGKARFVGVRFPRIQNFTFSAQTRTAQVAEPGTSAPSMYYSMLVAGNAAGAVLPRTGRGLDRFNAGPAYSLPMTFRPPPAIPPERIFTSNERMDQSMKQRIMSSNPAAATDSYTKLLGVLCNGMFSECVLLIPDTAVEACLVLRVLAGSFKFAMFQNIIGLFSMIFKEIGRPLKPDESVSLGAVRLVVDGGIRNFNGTANERNAARLVVDLLAQLFRLDDRVNDQEIDQIFSKRPPIYVPNVDRRYDVRNLFSAERVSINIPDEIVNANRALENVMRRAFGFKLGIKIHDFMNILPHFVRYSALVATVGDGFPWGPRVEGDTSPRNLIEVDGQSVYAMLIHGPPVSASLDLERDIGALVDLFPDQGVSLLEISDRIGDKFIAYDIAASSMVVARNIEFACRRAGQGSDARDMDRRFMVELASKVFDKHSATRPQNLDDIMNEMFLMTDRELAVSKFDIYACDDSMNLAAEFRTMGYGYPDPPSDLANLAEFGVPLLSPQAKAATYSDEASRICAAASRLPLGSQVTRAAKRNDANVRNFELVTADEVEAITRRFDRRLTYGQLLEYVRALDGIAAANDDAPEPIARGREDVPEAKPLTRGFKIDGAFSIIVEEHPDPLVPVAFGRRGGVAEVPIPVVRVTRTPMPPGDVGAGLDVRFEPSSISHIYVRRSDLYAVCGQALMFSDFLPELRCIQSPADGDLRNAGSWWTLQLSGECHRDYDAGEAFLNERITERIVANAGEDVDSGLTTTVGLVGAPEENYDAFAFDGDRGMNVDSTALFGMVVDARSLVDGQRTVDPASGRAGPFQPIKRRAAVSCLPVLTRDASVKIYEPRYIKPRLALAFSSS